MWAQSRSSGPNGGGEGGAAAAGKTGDATNLNLSPRSTGLTSLSLPQKDNPERSPVLVHWAGANLKSRRGGEE